MRKKLATMTAHGELPVSSPWANGELTMSSRWPKWSQPAVTELRPGPWLSCDLAVTEPWSYWRCRDWAVTSPWLSCDLTVTELWPRRHWAVTSPSRDWAVITVTIYFLMGSAKMLKMLQSFAENELYIYMDWWCICVSVSGLITDLERIYIVNISSQAYFMTGFCFEQHCCSHLPNEIWETCEQFNFKFYSFNFNLFYCEEMYVSKSRNPNIFFYFRNCARRQSLTSPWRPV